MVEHTVTGSLVSSSFDLAIWGSSILVISAWFFYSLFSRNREWSPSLLGRFVVSAILVGLVVWVGLVFAGVFSLLSLGLASGLLILLCLVVSMGIFGLTRFRLFLHLVFSCILVVLVVEFGDLALFNAPAAMNLVPVNAGMHWSFVEQCFSNLFYPYVSYAYLFFVFLGVVVFIWKVVPLKRFSGEFRGARLISALGRLGHSFDIVENGTFAFLRRRYVLTVAVLVSAVVSCLFVVFTVLPWVNPTNMLVSVDSPVYYQLIVHMHSVDFNSALTFALSNDRALFLVLIYALSFFASPIFVIQSIAALLIVLFGIVSLLVLRHLCPLREVWVLGVLLVPFSFQALGLIYSGYFANMLALILVFVYLVLFMRVERSGSFFSFFGLLAVSVLILFSHSWTWFVFAVSLVVFLFLEWRLAVADKTLMPQIKMKGVYVGSTIGVGLLCDLMRRLVSPVSSTASVVSTVQSSISLPNLGYVISGLRESVDSSLGGVFANSLLIFLSIVGFLVLIRFKSQVSNFLVSWVFVACLSILFASASLVFNRVLFLIPWAMLSSLGLYFVVKLFVSGFDDLKSWRFGVAVLILSFVFLVLLNGALSFLFNINIF